MISAPYGASLLPLPIFPLPSGNSVECGRGGDPQAAPQCVRGAGCELAPLHVRLHQERKGVGWAVVLMARGHTVAVCVVRCDMRALFRPRR